MARSTFKVLFYVNGSKEKNGIVPIMGRVTINGTVAQFSCKQSIPKTLWDCQLPIFVNFPFFGLNISGLSHY